MAAGTLLEISGPGIPPYTTRGATQTLDAIDASSVLARTVNGALIDLSPPQMRKYRSEISCEDVSGLALDAIWPGVVLTVDCISELGYRTTGGSPERPVVPDSTRVESGWTYYRPRLTMTVVQKTQSTNEYGAVVSWTLNLEEQ